MNKLFLLIIFIFCSTLLCNNAYSEIEVHQVIDGDTILIEKNNELLFVKIYGVDSPEIGQPYAEEAKKFVEDKLKDKQYTVELNNINVLSQYSCEVYYVENKTNRTRDLACMLLSNGYAVVDNQIKNEEKNLRYFSSQKYAKGQNLGVWSIKNFTYPWEYRKQNQIIDYVEADTKERINNFASKIAAVGDSSRTSSYLNFSDCYKSEAAEIFNGLKVPPIFVPWAINQAQTQAALICGPQFGKKVKITPMQVNQPNSNLKRIEDKLERIEQRQKYGY